MTERCRGSLARGWGWVFFLVSVFPASVATVIGGRLLSGSIHREIDSLVWEEIEEVQAALVEEEDVESKLEMLVPELAAHHPAISLAWRLEQPNQAHRDFGDTQILSVLNPPLREAMRVYDLAVATRAVRVDLPGGRALTLVVNGQGISGVIDTFWGIAGLTILFAFMASLVATRLFMRHLTRDFDRIAASFDALPARGVQGLPSELRPIAEELRQLLGHAEQRSLETQRFVVGLAHELRTPLQNLVGEAEVTLLRPRSAEEYRQHAQSALEESSRLAAAVDNLLILCASEDPARELRLEDFDLTEELTIRLESEARFAAQRNVGLTVDLDKGLVVHGDREALVRAIRNLVNNAIAWTAPGTEVSLTARRGEHALQVLVQDQGPGIPEAELESVWEAFNRGEHSEGSPEGFGLGLTIAKTAAKLHNGSILLRNVESGGLRAELTIPSERLAAAVDALGPARAEPKG
jgi:signal transduction histidine kinase